MTSEAASGPFYSRVDRTYNADLWVSSLTVTDHRGTPSTVAYTYRWSTWELRGRLRLAEQLRRLFVNPSPVANRDNPNEPLVMINSIDDTKSPYAVFP